KIDLVEPDAVDRNDAQSRQGGQQLARAADAAIRDDRSDARCTLPEQRLALGSGELEPPDELESPRQLALQARGERTEVERERAVLIHRWALGAGGLGWPISGAATGESGVGRNRTGIDGFAGRCMTILPPRHQNQEAPQGRSGASFAHSVSD